MCYFFLVAIGKLGCSGQDKSYEDSEAMYKTSKQGSKVHI
jgi:hypothetical protein